MLRFEHFVARHGEVAAEALIENLERYESVHTQSSLSLEERWKRLMWDPNQSLQ